MLPGVHSFYPHPYIFDYVAVGLYLVFIQPILALFGIDPQPFLSLRSIQGLMLVGMQSKKLGPCVGVLWVIAWRGFIACMNIFNVEDQLVGPELRPRQKWGLSLELVAAMACCVDGAPED